MTNMGGICRSCCGVHRGCPGCVSRRASTAIVCSGTCVRRGAHQGALQSAVLLDCTPGTAAIRGPSPLSLGLETVSTMELWATGWCPGRTATCDPFADQRHSGRDWTPDGTSYFSVGGGCRLLPRKPRWSAKSPPFSRRWLLSQRLWSHWLLSQRLPQL